MDRAKFYNALRSKINLTTQNVEGMEKVLDYLELTHVLVNDAADILATAWWESAQTMHPVKEAYWKDEAWRKANLRYFPWYGRGLVQTTFEANYRKIAVAMALSDDTFIKNPDLLLTFEYAIPALVIGMEKGIYTGKKLADYIDDVDESDAEDLREYVNARRIVNGTDQANKIGQLALNFENALRKGGYVSGPIVDHPPIQTPAPAQPEPQPVQVPVAVPTQSWWDWFKSWF